MNDEVVRTGFTPMARYLIAMGSASADANNILDRARAHYATVAAFPTHLSSVNDGAIGRR